MTVQQFSAARGARAPPGRPLSPLPAAPPPARGLRRHRTPHTKAQNSATQCRSVCADPPTSNRRHILHGPRRRVARRLLPCGKSRCLRGVRGVAMRNEKRIASSNVRRMRAAHTSTAELVARSARHVGARTGRRGFAACGGVWRVREKAGDGRAGAHLARERPSGPPGRGRSARLGCGQPWSVSARPGL